MYEVGSARYEVRSRMWDLRFIGTESSFLQSFLIYDFGGEKYEVLNSGRAGSLN